MNGINNPSTNESALPSAVSGWSGERKAPTREEWQNEDRTAGSEN